MTDLPALDWEVSPSYNHRRYARSTFRLIVNANLPAQCPALQSKRTSRSRYRSRKRHEISVDSRGKPSRGMDRTQDAVSHSLGH